MAAVPVGLAPTGGFVGGGLSAGGGEVELLLSDVRLRDGKGGGGREDVEFERSTPFPVCVGDIGD